MKPRHAELIVIGLAFILSLFFAATGRTSAQSGEPVHIIHLSDSGYERAHALAFSSQGKYLAVGGLSGVHLFDFQTLSKLDFIDTNIWARSVAFVPGTNILAAGLFDQTVKLWDVSDPGLSLRTLDGPQGWVRSISISGNGSLVASASDDDTLRVWNLENEGPVLILTENTSGIRAVALSPDGKLVAGALGDKTIRIWSVPDGQLVETLTGHTDWVRCLAFSPDGNLLASGAFDQTVRLWNVGEAREVRKLEGHTSSVLSVAFSPDGTTLASGSVDKSVRLWQVDRGQSIKVLYGHTDFVYAVAFSPDGHSLASGGGDNTVRIWDLDALNNVALSTTVADQDTSSDCRACHHRRGDVEPARVIELGCEGCHVGGISLTWCGGIPRAGGLGPTNPAYQNVPLVSGVPVNGREIGVVIASPGNGETLYVGGDYMAPEKINGKVYYAIGESPTKIKVQLDVIAGGQKVASFFTSPSENGDFSFRAELNSDDPAVFDAAPPNNALCASCHVRTGMTADLPKGDIRILISATAPNGDQAFDERWLRIDSSQRTTLPIQVIDDETGNPIPNLFVRASTVLYQWRARTTDAISDVNGNVQLNLESLSQSSTVYMVNIPSQVTHGLLYTGNETVQVKLEPGETSYPALTLTAHAQAGNLSGKLAGADGFPNLEDTMIWVVRPPAGPVYQAPLTADGTFVFEELPIDQYLVFADPFALAKYRLHATSQNVNLFDSPKVVMSLNSAKSRQVSGRVTLQDGSALPFAWVTVEGNPQATPINPISREYLVFDVPTDATYLTISAPGYYSLSQHIDGAQETLDFQLVPRPEMRRLPWGEGEVILSPETNATVDGSDIDLDFGWLWGNSSASKPLQVHVPGMDVSISKGEFALEKTTAGTAWLYLYSGQAKVTYDSGQDPTELGGGEMIALLDGAEPIPMNIPLAAGLHPVLKESPIAEVIQPSLQARLENRLVKAGISLAQIATFVAYMLSITALIAIPGFALLRARRKTPNPSPPYHRQ